MLFIATRAKNKEQIETQCRFIEHQNKYKLGEIKNKSQRAKKQPTKNKERRARYKPIELDIFYRRKIMLFIATRTKSKEQIVTQCRFIEYQNKI
ncbi:hypothetical protein ACKUSY_15510 [Myroides odoratus]